MKNTKNCGFTLIELVIVIAVIAILSAVLIPTFGGMIENARNSSRDQKARNAYTDYFAHHPTDDNSYLIIEVEDGGTKYHYNVIGGQIDLEGESKALSESYEGGTQYNGYVVYPASVEGFWQAKWDAMVTYETVKPKLVGIAYVDMLSSQFPMSHFLDNDDIRDFINFLRESNITFDGFAVTDDDKASALHRYYSVYMAYYSGDNYNNAENKVELMFIVGTNGHVYFNPPDVWEKETIIRSTEPISLETIKEFYNQAKSN